MKKLFSTALFVLLLLGGILVNATEVEVDFTQKDLLSKNLPLQLRGKAVLSEKGLTTAGKGTNQAVTSKKILKEFTPEGAFTFEADFTLDAAPKGQFYRYVFDNKYITLPNDKQQKYHKGFSVVLRAYGKGYRAYTAFGFGEKSVEVYSNVMPIKVGKKYHFEFDFNAAGQVAYYLDGKLISKTVVPAGNIAPSGLLTAFGNRIGSSYQPLNGTLHKVAVGAIKDRSVKPGTVLVNWDFSQPETYKDMFIRGKNTKVANGAVTVMGSGIAGVGGITTKEIEPANTPARAFELETEFALSSQFKRFRTNPSMIIDSKYVARPGNGVKDMPRHTGFMVNLQPRGGNKYRVVAAFGFGKNSAEAYSRDLTLELDKFYNLKMLFTATGKVVFTLDGENIGECVVPAGSLAPANLPTTVGDRHGSNYYPFGGSIKKIVIKEAEFTPVSVVPNAMHRKVFERGETPVAVAKVQNASLTALKDATVEMNIAGLAPVKKKVDLIPANSSIDVSFELDKYLLEKDYPATFTVRDNAGKEIAAGAFCITVVPEPGNAMPVILWGGQNPVWVKDAGFTHQSVGIFPIRGLASDAMRPDLINRLDRHMRLGLYAYSAVVTKYRFLLPKRYLRTNRQGKPYGRANLEASNPGARADFAAAAESIAKVIGDHPGWKYVLLNSEVRDSSNPSFGGTEPANFKKYAGYDIPKKVTGKYPISHKSTPNFPWDRIVDGNDPELVFYRWFWREGDGWNPMHTLLHDTLHKNIKRKDFNTFYDPAVRVPPLWGSGGNVDMLGQWTYAYPDPIKIAQATDEVAAMADGNPGQKISSMTQIICYRSQVAPMNVKVDDPPEWLAREGKARFVTIPPDIFRVALWSKLSRRLDAIMYHGSGSLFAPENHSYRYTNSQTKAEFKKVMNYLVKPLGPVLKTVPEYTPEIAILESYTASLYSPGLFAQGWSNKWAADLHLALQWAHLQPKIYYEEHFTKDRVKVLPKVLFIPGAEVLTKDVLAKLQQLQKKGVILVGDEYTTPALMVDLRIKSVARRSTDPAGSKKALQALGKEIAAKLKSVYTSPMSASNQDIVLYRRGIPGADYVFAINDKRTFGNYLGQWKRLMEKGLPNSGTVTVKSNAQAAYDLVKHKAIDLKRSGKNVTYSVDIAPADGALVLLLDKAIARTNVVQTMAKRGEKYTLTVQVTDKNNNPVKAYIPLEITMTDAQGSRLPKSDFYTTDANGKLVIDDIAAVNMAAGEVKTVVRNLADGKVVTLTNTVK